MISTQQIWLTGKKKLKWLKYGLQQKAEEGLKQTLAFFIFDNGFCNNAQS